MNLNREEALVALALTKRPSELVAFLNRECPDDLALRQRLEALLAHPSAAGPRSDESHETSTRGQGRTELGPPGQEAPLRTIKLDFTDPPDEAVGQTLGRYKLLEKIGEGGCGVVYVAEQTEPVRRRVALKVIKLGMDTKAVVARFEAERQALAMMDHPNIARVLDAGTTETGRPFFVMELVRGIRITDYCDKANLTTKERLDLFIKVCQAIQHAHQKGIIHRDIKPSNILVTLHDGVPVPKVIDFGIAKATEGRLTDATVYTQLHQFIGTPAYMSPEQAEMSGLDIDTRSDIYSLGVLLYELLVGSTPFDAKELVASGLDTMRKTIREKEPVRPSTRFATLKGEELTTTAKRRSADTSKLLHQLKGDLDWIVMKCLEKDRTRRYDTANGLAMDLKRHLNNEPVVARPPSRLYEFQKTVRRHKFGFTAAAGLMVVLAIGVLLSTWQSVRATRAKRDALSARQQAEASERKALAAQANETRLRQQAEAEGLAARQRAYASDMNVAAQALAGNNLGRALDLLNRQRPGTGQRDLRGWEWRYLWQQTRGDALFTLCQKSTEINSLAVSPDGNCLAVGVRHRDGLIVWDLRTRQELVRLAKNEQSVRATFSPTEPLLAYTSSTSLSSGQERTTLRLWNTATRQIAAESPLEGDCLGVAFSKDGRTLVTSTRVATGVEGQMTLWHMPDGAKLASYTADQSSISPGTGFAASPDARFAAYGLPNGRIGVMDLRNGKELWTAVASKEYILSLAFSPDGKTLASGAGFADPGIRLWEVATGKSIGQFDGHGSWVSSLVFWPDGKKLASSSADQTIRIWDVASQRCLDVLRGQLQEVWRLALLPDDKTLVSGAKDGTVCFWDTSVTHSHQPRLTVPTEDVVNWAFASDSQSILVVDKRGVVSRRSGADLQQKALLLDVGTNVFSSCFSPDGRFLACCWTNGVLQVWDPSRRVLMHQLTNTTGPMWPCAFLADGKKLVTYSLSGNLLHERDLTIGVELQSWQAPAAFNPAALAPDERSFMALGYGGDVVCRNLTDRSLGKVDLDALEAVSAGFSPGGKLFAVASDLGHARVWDTASWRPVTTLGGFLNGAHSVSFSRDGRRLAIASDGKEAVRLWDTDSWQDVFTLEAQGTGFQGAWFSPDGNTIMWGSDAALSVWRAPSWEQIAATEAKETTGPNQPGT